MLTGNWLEINKLNDISIAVSGKKIPLRCTLYQIEKYQQLVELKKSEEKTKSLQEMINDEVSLLEIILNPVPNEVQFTQSDICEKFDLDQIKLITRVWLERKVFLPKLEADPINALPEKGR
ncbi:MAG: hypothetical protein HQM10_26510 [Candidatus Riflebacteria bacterium]|nr:hypothetical protein [Candidatus Riflebacteria bacterium]